MKSDFKIIDKEIEETDFMIQSVDKMLQIEIQKRENIETVLNCLVSFKSIHATTNEHKR